MENLASLDPWISRPPAFADTWISEAYTRDTEALTRALQMSLTKNEDLLSPKMTPPTTTASNFSGSDIAPPLPKCSAVPGVMTGKVSKRKSRARKRCQTTFITADPANFRQMVQQVTGVKFGTVQLPPMKPEPQIPVSGVPEPGGYPPTLDTSAFLLLDHHPQQQRQEDELGVGVSSDSSPAIRAGRLLGPDPEADGVRGPLTGFDFDAFSIFPTLESWEVM